MMLDALQPYMPVMYTNKMPAWSLADVYTTDKADKNTGLYVPDDNK